MPWKETDRVSERLKFIQAVAADPEASFTELCRHYGVAPKTGYKWLKRYEEVGPAGLVDSPPFAKKHPRATDTETVAAITKLRKEHPRWGPRKLLQRLKRLEPSRKWPAASTLGDILKRQGLIIARRRRQLVRPPIPPSPVPKSPNDVWAMDFKGHFALASGGPRCHPFTLTDEASRYLLRCQGTEAETEAAVRPQLEQCFETYGLPYYLRSDNGSPFAANTVGGMSRLVLWLVQLGITPVRIEPGKPQQNGKHERFHRTLKLETPVLNSFAAQQEAFDSFRYVYNEERPHEALGGATPAEHYRTSTRKPGAAREPTYDARFVVKLADKYARVNIGYASVGVGSLLAQRPIGVVEVDEGIHELRYGPILLGYFDEAVPTSRLASELPSRTLEAWSWCI